VKILIVDDEKEFLNILGDAFKGAGFEVDLLDNAGFADRKLSKDRYDAILLDLRMPYVDGYGLLKIARLGVNSKMTPAFIMSGALDVSAVTRLRQMGVKGFFVKPPNFEDMISKIKAHITASESPLP
jgi:two-component system sensor histidine kinase/response regulator